MKKHYYVKLYTYRVDLAGDKLQELCGQEKYDRHDKEQILFMVKKKYVRKWLRAMGYKCSTLEFVEEMYTYDESERLFYYARQKGWIARIWIVRW